MSRKPKPLPGTRYISTKGLFTHGKMERSVDEFIKIARMIYGNRYTYKRVVYRHSRTPVEITCPKHGPFSITPARFFQGHDCPRCHKEARFGKDRVKLFIQKARAIHGKNRYDYSRVSFENLRDHITIICPVHGEFKQPARAHAAGIGCSKCGTESMAEKKTKTFAEFLKRARQAHGTKYRYDETSYRGISQKITIICPVHGEFRQKACSHGAGIGCPQCGTETAMEKQRKPYAEFLKLARQAHGTKYRYDEASYCGVKQKMTIICPVHGEFRQLVYDHLEGFGCPECGNKTRAEKQQIPYAEFLKRARKAHGTKYRYDETSYCGIKQKITIICPVHGEFRQVAGEHTKNSGCPQCGREAVLRKKEAPLAENPVKRDCAAGKG